MKAFFGSSMFANPRTVARIEALEAKLYCDSESVSKREQAELEASLKFLEQRKNGQARRALDRMRTTTVARSASVVRARRGRGAAVRSSAASGDSPSDSDDSSDGEPPRPRIISRLYSYQSAAVLLDCSVQTLYNQVNTGRIPAPIKTAVGHRFSQEQLEQIIAGVRLEVAAPAPLKNKAGRPRIALAIKGVQS